MHGSSELISDIPENSRELVNVPVPRNCREFPGSRRKPFYCQESPRIFSLFLVQYNRENSQDVGAN